VINTPAMARHWCKT